MQKEKLFNNLTQFLGEKKACIICHKNKKELWAADGIFNAVKCKFCGLVWIDPFLTQEGLDIYYTNYIAHRLQDKKKMVQRNKMYEIDISFLENFIRSGKLLDIGCNGGFFLAKFRNSFDKYGIEVDERAVEFARKTFPFGKNIYKAQLVNAELKNETFDCVTMRGVIEHFPDPRKALKKVSKLLKKNGVFFISATPNIDSFCANIYREKWNQFNPIQHIYYFSADTLNRLAFSCGFKLIAIDYPYLHTPYADSARDYSRVINDLLLIKEGKRNSISSSPAFWGNMMTLLFRKVKQ